MLRAVFGCLVLVGIMAALPEPVAAAAPAVNWQYRTDWSGDPYLVTNSLNSVSLVLNPDLLAANSDYQYKVTALASTVMGTAEGTFTLVKEMAREAQSQESLAAKLRQTLARFTGHSDRPATDSLRSGTLKKYEASSSRSAQLPPARDLFSNSPLLTLSLFIDRWALFCLVLFFLARRVWRYFNEVDDDDDDFANHLETLAVAHRWIFPVYLALLTTVAVMEFVRFGNFFFSLSVLFLAASLRRYYCEGDFADYPKAKKIHLALRCLLLWLGWMQGCDHYLVDLATWFHWPVFAWVLLALATAVFSQFYNHQDFAEHRGGLYWFGLGFLFFGILGAAAGHFFWRSYSGSDSAFWLCLGSGVLLAWTPLLVYFRRWSSQVSQAVVGRMLYDLVFSENLFAEKIRKKKHLPSVLLLRHWREHGQVEKAWQSAQSHLFKEARALPVWLFALETAVLYRRHPGAALEILKRLCDTEAFPFDHRRVAVGQMQGWMTAAGFPFDPASFKIERPPLKPSALTDRVEAKCRAGRFGEAVTILLEVLQKDPLNEAAFTQLVRIYCQDLKNRPRAEKLIAEAGETFSPKLLNFLGASLDEWMQLPIRSVVRRRRLLDRLLRRTEPEPSPRKIILTFNPRPAPPQAQDPLAVHLERLKQSQAESRPDTTGGGVFDHVEKLLLERRLGTAVELLKEQAEAEPANFELWLRYAEAHGNHCGQVFTAEKIIMQMDRSGNFKKAQIKKAYARLKKWRKKHPLPPAGW